MGATTKPLAAIICDYIICAVFGATYFCVSNYMDINTQCIPGVDENDSKCLSDNNNYMKQATPLLAFPYQQGTVPVSCPYIFGAVTWFIILLIALCSIKPGYQDVKAIFFKFEALFREVLTAVIITQTVIGFIKSFVGRPRPNYYDYITVDPSDAVSSFPSGHASSTFCIHILLVFHVIGSIYWSYNNDNVVCGIDNMHALFGAKLWQKTRDLNGFNVLLVMCLLVLPIWISCTRIMDYYHDYSDVIGGAMLGILVASIVFSVFHNELYPYNPLYNKSVREPLLSNVSDS